MNDTFHDLSNQPLLLVLGCTGRIAQPFLQTFTREGVRLRILARSPQVIQARYPQAEVFSGSMLNEDDLRCAMQGVDGAFLITPIGGRNQIQIEFDAAQVAIQAGLESNLPHLIFVSVTQIDQPTGVPLLDVKRLIEQMVAESGLPWSSLRAGSYMEDVIDERIDWMRRGVWLFPVPPDRPLSFTSQQDVARVAVQLLRTKRPLNATLDVVEPILRTPREVSHAIKARLGKKVFVGGTPLLWVMFLLQPLLCLKNPKMITIFELCRYLNRAGLPGRCDQMAEVLPGFPTTSLENHLDSLMGAVRP